MVKLGPIGAKIDCSCLLDVVRRRRFGRNTTETRVPICPSGNAIEGLISLASGCEKAHLLFGLPLPEAYWHELVAARAEASGLHIGQSQQYYP
ncbi:hypothetical protein FOBRF1_000473 [Fusarium oxysporum]